MFVVKKHRECLAPGALLRCVHGPRGMLLAEGSCGSRGRARRGSELLPGNYTVISSSWQSPSSLSPVVFVMPLVLLARPGQPPSLAL